MSKLIWVPLVYGVFLSLTSCGVENEATQKSAKTAESEQESSAVLVLKDTPFGSSLMDANADTIDQLISETTADELRMTDKGGANYLYAALLHGYGTDLSVVKKLVEAGVPAVSYDSIAQTHVLEVAAANGDWDIVKFLIALPDMNYRPQGNLLHFIATTGLSEGLDALLVARGTFPADWFSELSANKDQPLHAAARNGSTTIIKRLVPLGAPIDGLDGGGRTPIMIAALFERSESVATLIELGASLEAVDSVGKSAADYIAEYLPAYKQGK